MSKQIVLHGDKLTKAYNQGNQSLIIFSDLQIRVHQGEFIGLIGPSGSGKSTLLNILGLLDAPTHGTVAIADDIVDFHNDSYLTKLRQQFIGFVFQFHHLLPEFTALENVMIPLIIQGVSEKTAQEEALKSLNDVKMSHRGHHRPGELSGGEQQRVALARALIRKPQLLLADEPTGNLDPETAEHIFELLRKLTKKQNTAVIMATHNPHFINKMDTIIDLDTAEI